MGNCMRQKEREGFCPPAWSHFEVERKPIRLWLFGVVAFGERSQVFQGLGYTRP
jgi:hypothetical protein